jgi:hypothetical protein
VSALKKILNHKEQTKEIILGIKPWSIIPSIL